MNHADALSALRALLAELPDHQQAKGRAAMEALSERGWDMVSGIAIALGMDLPPDDDGFWGHPVHGPIHFDDLPHHLPGIVACEMERILTDRVHPAGPLTLPPPPECAGEK